MWTTCAFNDKANSTAYNIHCVWPPNLANESSCPLNEESKQKLSLPLKKYNLSLNMLISPNSKILKHLTKFP